MEGTRNERVAILITSYVIGFMTAFIGFGVVQSDDSATLAQIPAQNTASVIQAHQEAQVTESNIFLDVDTEGLFLTIDDERTLLSATVSEDSSGYFEDGAHVAISNYALSNDKTQVYFCELPSAGSGSCRPYIYSLTEEVVYPVLVNGERVAFDAAAHEVSWSPEGELIVD
jgi:type II secretory pathway pseudopilin PulG